MTTSEQSLPAAQERALLPSDGLMAALQAAEPLSSGDGSEPDAARAEIIDRMLHAWQARYTYSLSPAALMEPFADWAMHFINGPGKQLLLTEKALLRAGPLRPLSCACRDRPRDLLDRLRLGLARSARRPEGAWHSRALHTRGANRHRPSQYRDAAGVAPASRHFGAKRGSCG